MRMPLRAQNAPEGRFAEMLVHIRALSPERAVLLISVPILIILAPGILASSRLLDIAITYAIFSIALYGVALLYGQVGLLSIAHAALMGIGSYTAAILLIQIDIGFWAVLPICALITAATAGLLGVPSLRMGGYHFVIVTFAFGSLLVIAATNFGGAEARLGLTGGAQGLDIERTVGPLFGQEFNITLEQKPFYYLTIGFLFATIVAIFLLAISPFGRSLRAIRENEVLAKSVGIHTGAYKISAFMVSGGFAGVAGALFAYKLRHITPQLFGSFEGVEFALMVLLGGSLPILGPLVGAMIVGFLPEFLDAIGLGLSPFQRQMVFGLLLIAVITMLPNGLVTGARDLYLYLKHRAISSVRSRPPPPHGGGLPEPAVELSDSDVEND
jgi:branched-chain amino acid transport system permease protein